MGKATPPCPFLFPEVTMFGYFWPTRPAFLCLEIILDSKQGGSHEPFACSRFAVSNFHSSASTINLVRVRKHFMPVSATHERSYPHSEVNWPIQTCYDYYQQQIAPSKYLVPLAYLPCLQVFVLLLRTSAPLSHQNQVDRGTRLHM